MNNICLVKPNGNNCYTEELQKIKAYEPPIWLAILADFYKTNIIIDAEVENYNTQETINKILSYNSDKVVILSSGNHPSAFIQAQEEMNKLKDLLSLHYPLNKIECIDKLPINPIRYKIKWELLDLNKYRCHNWHAITNNNINNPYGVIYTSVSCPMNCHFCTVKNFYYTKQFEQRLIEDIIADFKIIK